MKTVSYDETKWKLVPVEPSIEMRVAYNVACETESGDDESWLVNAGYVAMLADASHKEKLALRSHPPIKIIVDRIEAEKVQKVSNVDVGGLLNKLNGISASEPGE